MKKTHRIFHTWDKWECYPAGFYENGKDGIEKSEAEKMYADFLSDPSAFESAIKRVFTEWPNSCEHYLTNESMNRIAWIGQAAACIHLGLPSCFRSGYFLLNADQRAAADNLALKYLNEWLTSRDFDSVGLEGAGVNASANLY